MPEQSEPRPRPRPLSTASLGSRRFSRPVSMVSSVIPEEGCDDDDYPRPNLRAHMNSSITAIPEGNEKFVRPQPSITINTEAAESSRDLESNQEAEFSRMQVIGEIFKEYWMEDIDPKKAVVPLSAYCFMTGFMCALRLRRSRFFFAHACAGTRSAFPPSLCGVPSRQATACKYVLAVYIASVPADGARSCRSPWPVSSTGRMTTRSNSPINKPCAPCSRSSLAPSSAASATRSDSRHACG